MKRLNIGLACAALVGVLACSPSALAAPAKAKAAAIEPAKDHYTSEADAKVSCPTDRVVWVNLKSKIYHVSNSKTYGKTKIGAYMCEKESVAAGFRAPKTSAARKSKAA
jgi:hypothetical protein